MTELEKAYDDISNIRRPLILIRGKSLTKEQLIQLVANEEPLFSRWSPTGEDLSNRNCFFADRGYCGTLRNICFRKGFDWLDGWLLSDGTIYGSYYLPKYPEKDEWFDTFEYLARAYDFLDMTVTVIDSNESYCYGCPVITEGSRYGKHNNKSCKCICNKYSRLANYIKDADKYHYGALKDIPHHIQPIMNNHYLKTFLGSFSFWYVPKNVSRDALLTLHLHDGQIDEYTESEAGKWFRDYDSFYGDFRLAITQESSFFRCSDKPDKPSYVRFPTQFFRDCLEYRNIPISVWDEKIAPEYLMKPESTKECVVDKDWLFQMYDTHFKGTILDVDNLKKVGVL